MLGSRKTAHYGKSSGHIDVVKGSTGSGFHQGVSHMGRDICAHVKCKGKQSLLWNDNHAERFVHKNRFQPLSTGDIENCIENKCQNDVSTRASKESQAGVLPVGLTVKDGNKIVRRKKTNPSNHSTLDVKGEWGVQNPVIVA